MIDFRFQVLWYSYLPYLHQLPEEAKELDKELRAVTKEKNEAVRGQDFEKVCTQDAICN